MNPLTLVKRIQSINAKESDLGISEEALWHAKYKDSAYVFVGGLAYDLTEGDLLAVFAQYGEVVDVNLIRDKGTGKSKGFAFLAYEDQRSTTLAVDNLDGAQVLGRTIRVDHRSKYTKHEEEDEETRQQNREARGVCRAFQRGDGSVLEAIPANFLTMRKELQILVGVMEKIEVPSGSMRKRVVQVLAIE